MHGKEDVSSLADHPGIQIQGAVLMKKIDHSRGIRKSERSMKRERKIMEKKTKMTLCSNCKAEMPANAKVCPSCGAKNRKPFYRKW